MTTASIYDLLGKEADSLLNYTVKGFPREKMHIPGPDFVDRVLGPTDRSPTVLRNFQSILNHGRLAKTGYVSILPVDQGLEHTAAFSFSNNIDYFDPENICKLALEGGCNAVATTLGVLASVSRKYAHKIPFLVKFNHNELLTYPTKHDQILYTSMQQAFNLGAVAAGATIYFGSEESSRQIVEVGEMFEQAHELGMVTVLWCYTRNNAFKKDGVDYHDSTDLASQANHIGATLKADIVKQKLPTKNGGFKALNFAKFNDKMYELTPGNHPIELCRYQVAHGYMGRVPLINSGGESTGKDDFADAVKTAVINKRAGGIGLISGRKAFNRPLKEGIQMLNTIQDVYLDPKITIA